MSEVFKPHAKQAAFMKALGEGYKYFCLLWSRQLGKTHSIRYVIKSAALSLDGGVIVYIAPELEQAKQLAWEPIFEALGGMEKDGGLIVKYNKNSHSITVRNQYGTETIIYFFGWNGGRVEAIRGKTVDLLVIDEVDQCKNFVQYMKEVIRPTQAVTYGKIIMISTPKNFGNMYWLKQMADRFPKRYFFSKATYLDNPRADVEMIEEEKEQAIADGTLNSWLQEYMAEFVMRVGAIFDTFKQDVHVLGNVEILETDTPEQVMYKQQKIEAEKVSNIESSFKSRVVGVDFAYGESGITALMFGGFTHDNKLVITREIYTNEISPRNIADKIKAYDPQAVYADPADPWRVNELKEFGVPVIQFTKKAGSILSGLERMRTMFAEMRLFVHRDCENFIAEVGSAEWREIKTGVMRNAAPDPNNDDHALDAVRYIAQNAPEHDYYIHANESRNIIKKAKRKQIVR